MLHFDIIKSWALKYLKQKHHQLYFHHCRIDSKTMPDDIQIPVFPEILILKISSISRD